MRRRQVDGDVATRPRGVAWAAVASTGALVQHLDVPDGVVQTWMRRSGSVMLASLIHLMENTLEDMRARDVADLLHAGVHSINDLSRNPGPPNYYTWRYLHAWKGLLGAHCNFSP
jgi:hypothetical protein